MPNWFKSRSQKYQERQLGSYILGATLGVGGYAKVKLGIHKESGEKVALKILFADKTGKISESKKKQVNRAIELLQKVNHKNVLRLLEYNKNGQYPEVDGTKTPCITMALEHAGNGELFDYLMFTGYFEEVVARSYFHQLIDGLDAIHKMGFAHRDLKPENLLLDKNYTLKIADFGFATVFRTEDNQEIKMKTACGTKGYLAPEVLKGKKYQQSVDIFAAGIILFITYAGFPPFNDAITTDWWWNRLDNGWKERANGHLLDRKKEWSKHGLFWAAHERTRKFPVDLKDFILKMLHPDPQQRPTIGDIRSKPWKYYQAPAKLFGSKEKKKLSKIDRHTVNQTKSWYQKETKGNKELGQYLEKRQNIVRKERAKKILEQQKNIINQGPNGRTTEIKDWFQKDQQQRIDPDNYFDKNIESYVDGTWATTPYYFLTKQRPVIVSFAFESAAKQNIGSEIIFNPKDTQTTIRCSIDNLETEFEVRQYIASDDEDNDDNTYVVVCKRLRGDPLAFKKIIDIFWKHEYVIQVMDVQSEVEENEE